MDDSTMLQRMVIWLASGFGTSEFVMWIGVFAWVNIGMGFGLWAAAAGTNKKGDNACGCLLLMALMVVFWPAFLITFALERLFKEDSKDAHDSGRGKGDHRESE